MDLLRGYAIEPNPLIPSSRSGRASSASRIGAPPTGRLVFSRVNSCYTCMKKSQRSFTFEVKRSRLATQKASTFQRYVVAPASADVRNVQNTSGSTSVRARDPILVRSEGRILPNLLGEKVWVEEPVLPAPVAPEPVEARETPNEPAIEPSPSDFAMVDLPADQADEEPSRPKRARRLARSPDDLPRGERWKRRLPRGAW
jgi:hypothetical protein